MPLADIGAALERRVAALQDAHPGVGLEKHSGKWRVVVPDGLRLGHDAHFIQLTRRFLDYAQHPRSLPAWEHANILAKYYVCTAGVALSRGEN